MLQTRHFRGLSRVDFRGVFLWGDRLSTRCLRATLIQLDRGRFQRLKKRAPDLINRALTVTAESRGVGEEALCGGANRPVIWVSGSLITVVGASMAYEPQ